MAMTKKEQDAIRARLAALEEKGGGVLTPDAVVADAKSPRSPLHKHFDWDDGKAAQKWRIEQVRTLIRSITVVISTDDRKLSVVAYVRDPERDDGDQGYTSVARIRKNKDRAREVLVDEFSRAAASLRRARELAAAFGLARETDAVRKRVETLSTRVPQSTRASAS